MVRCGANGGGDEAGWSSDGSANGGESKGGDGVYIDDVTGEILPPSLVQAARKEELQYFHKRPMYTKVPIQECINNIGKMPIRVRWVDHNKGTTNAPDIRSRLVAMEFNKGPMEGVFAAMPPLEAKRLLFSLFATLRMNSNEKYASS